MCDMHAHNREIFRPLHSSTHTLIHYLKGEELALSSRVTPVADTGLVGDSGSDSPPRDVHRVDTYNNDTYKVYVNKTKTSQYLIKCYLQMFYLKNIQYIVFIFYSHQTISFM